MLVQCQTCNKQISVTERLYGRKVKCECGTVMRMPTSPSGALPEIQFQCPECMQRLSVPGDASGEVTACPCGARIRVPQAPAPLTSNDPYALPAEYSAPVSMADELSKIGLDPMHHDPLGAESGGLAPLQDPGVSAGDSGSPYGGATTPQPPYQQPSTPQISDREVVHKVQAQDKGGGDGTSGSLLSGIGMMVGAVVWFLGGLALGIIFYYPLILFFIGLFTAVKGMFDSD